MSTIALQGGHSWLEVSRLPLTHSFEELWQLHPEERGKVVMVCQGEAIDRTCHRWHQSYGHTPPRDPESTKSYMFSGLHPLPTPDLPEAFQYYLELLNAGGARYNNVVVNWYDSNDYIALHADYETGLSPGSNIAVLSFCETGEDYPVRTFRVKAMEGGEIVDLPLEQGTLIRMCGDTQKFYRHGVAQLKGAGRRISLTFRQFES